MSVFGAFLVCIFPHSDLTRRDTDQKNSEYGHFSPRDCNAQHAEPVLSHFAPTYYWAIEGYKFVFINNKNYVTIVDNTYK